MLVSVNRLTNLLTTANFMMKDVLLMLIITILLCHP